MVDLSKFVSGEVTAHEAGISTAVANQLVEDGLIKRTSTRKTGKRGRPPFEYGLTAKGKRRIK